MGLSKLPPPRRSLPGLRVPARPRSARPRGHSAAERGRGLAEGARSEGGAGGGGRAPPRGWGRPAAARRCAARVRARPPASPRARSVAQGLKTLVALLMLGRPRSWLFRVAFAAAALLRPEQHARSLAARPVPRPRSQAPGKCAASPQPPGSAASRQPGPRAPPRGAVQTGKASRPRPQPAERPRCLHYGPCPRERGWSRRSCSRCASPAPPPGAGRQGAPRSPASPRGWLPAGPGPLSSFSSSRTLPKLFSLRRKPACIPEP